MHPDAQEQFLDFSVSLALRGSSLSRLDCSGNKRKRTAEHLAAGTCWGPDIGGSSSSNGISGCSGSRAWAVLDAIRTGTGPL